MSEATQPWIVVATATIMDGLVVRWYDTEGAALEVRPHVSASRNRVLVHINDDRTATALPDAEEAHRLLRLNYEANYERVKAMATHDHPFFGGTLTPITREAS